MGDLPPADQMHAPVPNISVERLMEVIEKMQKLSDEDKAEIMKNLRRKKAEMEGKVLPDENAPIVTYESMILIILGVMVIYIISLFAYRIYKNNQPEKPTKSAEKPENRKGKKIT